MDTAARVLFVEGDDPTAVSSDSFTAFTDGFDVTETASWSADERYDEYDCVVSNYALSEGDGVELVAAVRASSPTLPVVLYTAVGDETTARDALRAGAADYVDADTTATVETEAARLERRLDAVVTGAADAAVGESDGADDATGGDDGELVAFKRAVDAVDAGVVISEDGVHVYANDSAAAITGFDGVDELVGRPWTDLHAPEEAARIESESAEALERAGRWTDEVELTHSTLEGRPVHLTVTRLDASRTISIFQDVTERRRRERELRRTNELLERLLGSLPVGVLVEDESRTVLAANDRLCDLFGLDSSGDELHGRPYDQVAERLHERVSDATAFAEETERIVADGGLHEGTTVTTVCNETLVRSHTPLSLPEGRGSLWVYHDDTGHRRREAELERGRDALRRVQRIASIGGWELDATTNELRWTEETKRLHGVPESYEPTVEEALGFYVESDRERIRERVERCLETGEGFQERFRIETVNGNQQWVRAQGEAIRESGSVVALRGTFQDITEQVAREQQLETTTTQLETLNRILRHDIRNDMSVIVGWADILRDHVDEEGEEILDRILTNGRDTLELTDVARDAVETIAGDGTADVEPTALEAVLRREVTTRRETFPNATIELGPVPSVRVAANPLLGSVFRNLLNNAVSHHDGDSPTVRVSVEHDAETVSVRVADDGPGIPETQRETIFGKGEKGLNSHGTGIGLYLVGTLVDAYGGHVRVEDAADGATFVVELRRVD
ncbi:PAS domain S-box protein [Halogeometricum limi]|uniref:histidine kinase n=1 Tax=Halogeometricum limi TaxID=555875 RepID=A0A1I6G0Z1_9EURY|nr:PAS domain S-box protein [Halogeometricum limi]SFR35832.1 PAS domain S-box-containing protein [Halogeometricum limi]